LRLLSVMNNLPFVDGGVAGDVSRLISSGGNSISVATGASATEYGSGALYAVYRDTSMYNSGSGGIRIFLYFDSSRAVPVGAENSPRTLSILYWRRVA